MKNKIVLLALFLGLGVSVRAQLISENILPLFTLKRNTGPSPEGYGFSTDKPLPTGTFVGALDGMMIKMMKFYNSFTWPNGDKLDFSKRSTARSPSGGILDCYTMINPQTKDTIKLYTDPYNAGAIFLPKGFTFSTSKLLEPQVQPIVKLIESYNETRDSYADKVAKENQGKILFFIKNNVGFDFFFDEEIIRKLVQDKTINPALSTYLFGVYMMNSFLAYAKGSGNERSEGMETMKKAWKDATALHSELKHEGLEQWLGSK